MKSSGVSRFLSRRDKHHEKRPSKSTTGKVCLPASASCTSLMPLLHHASHQRLRRAHRRHSQSLDTLYHKLPSALRASVEDSFSFIQRNTPSLSSLTSAVAQHSPQRLSDQFSSQSRLSNHVSPDLYTIFTNDDTSPTPDKDVEKKVRRSRTTLHPPPG